MIPKQVFYMWCGSEKPIDVEMSLLSWRQNLPDYKIIEIDENSTQFFNFIETRHKNEFFDFAYRNKMWAYVADYVRCEVLEKFGGIWLDTDVTVVKDFGDLLNNGLFFGRETEGGEHIETAVIGAKPHHPIIKEFLQFYSKEIWQSDLYTGPRIATEILRRHGFDAKATGIVKLDNVSIYPPDYFFPLASDQKFIPTCVTSNTRTIHWWKASWGRKNVTDWLKNKHKIGKEKALSADLATIVSLYIFGFLRIASYYPQENKITLFGMPFIKIKRLKNKNKALLFGFIPLLKWR